MRRTAFMLGVILAVGIGVGGITDHDLNAQPMQTSKIPVNGVELNYVEQGAGEPVVLVHGALRDFRSWEPQLAPFAQRYHVISYSRRYHYPNTWMGDGSDYSATLHAQDLAALITGLGLGPVHVVGHSYGAYTALCLALMHPELVRTLVLGEPPVIPLLEASQRHEAVLREWANGQAAMRQAFASGNLEDGVRTFIDWVNGQGTFDRLPATVRDSLLDNARELRVEVSAPGFYPAFTCDDAQRIRAPALLLVGERSPHIFHLITDELERCLANKERVLISGASHGMPRENPQAYNAAVLAFLAQH